MIAVPVPCSSQAARSFEDLDQETALVGLVELVQSWWYIPEKPALTTRALVPANIPIPKPRAFMFRVDEYVKGLNVVVEIAGLWVIMVVPCRASEETYTLCTGCRRIAKSR